MRQKLTACTDLCLLGCILQASAKDGLDFSGSCHFLCTLFSLTFSPWPPCYTTCGVGENPPSRTLLCNPTLTSDTCSSFFLSFRLPFPWPQTLSYLFSRTHCSSLHPFTSSLLVTPSCLSCEACKNTCAFQLFVRVHKCTNAWMSVGCQSEEVKENCDGKNGDYGAENSKTHM